MQIYLWKHMWGEATIDEKRAGIRRYIPLLAPPQGGVAASSRKFREATEADAAGVVFLLDSSENHLISLQRRRFVVQSPRWPRQQKAVYPSPSSLNVSESALLSRDLS